MESIKTFYNGLDAINKIIFWGVIVVIVLIIIFVILLINKKREDKKRLEEQEEDLDEDFLEDNPVKVETYQEEEHHQEPTLSYEEEYQEPVPTYEPVKNIVEDEKNFVAEEHVLEYEKKEIPHQEYREPVTSRPYEKNVLREMSLNQTSPIGISNKNDNLLVKKENYIEKNSQINNSVDKAEPIADKKIVPVDTAYTGRFQRNNSFYNKEEVKKEKFIAPSSVIREMQEYEDIKVDKEENNKSFLEEVSEKMSASESDNGIERTDYEIKQEEDAIISYQELMAKKDSIETIEEEDAVISMDELLERQNKTYNITNKEEDESFLSELKKFRNDL